MIVITTIGIIAAAQFSPSYNPSSKLRTVASPESTPAQSYYSIIPARVNLYIASFTTSLTKHSPPQSISLVSNSIQHLQSAYHHYPHQPNSYRTHTIGFLPPAHCFFRPHPSYLSRTSGALKKGNYTQAASSLFQLHPLRGSMPLSTLSCYRQTCRYARDRCGL